MRRAARAAAGAIAAGILLGVPSPATIPPRPLDELARKVLSSIDRARTGAGRRPLVSPPGMRRAARRRALEIAARPQADRLRQPARSGHWLEVAGLPRAGRDVEKVILLRDVGDPAAEALRLFGSLEQTWSFALSDAARAGAVGAARAPDGWIVVVIAIASGPPGSTGRTLRPRFTAEELAALAGRIAGAVDRARRDHRLPPLMRDARLDEVAGHHASDLAERGRLDHRGRDGSSLADRLHAGAIGYRVAAENLALIEGAADPVTETVEGWLASPGHRSNMLDARVRTTGLGIAQDRAGRLFVVQLFVAPPVPAERPEGRG